MRRSNIFLNKNLSFFISKILLEEYKKYSKSFINYAKHINSERHKKEIKSIRPIRER